MRSNQSNKVENGQAGVDKKLKCTEIVNRVLRRDERLEASENRESVETRKGKEWEGMSPSMVCS